VVDAARAHVVAVLTRAPSAGGKSRLFASLSRPADAACLEALLLDTLDAARRPGVVPVVTVEPPAGCDEVRRLVPDGVAVMPQAVGTLGDRMRAAMDELFASGAGAVALIGSDLPDLPPHLIDTAFAMLTRDPRRLVLGPADDGGYYLIAATRTPGVFTGIPWGTPGVLAATVAAACEAGLPVHLLDPWHDLDTAGDLRRLLEGGRTDAAPAWRTRRWARDQGLLPS
jgi:uncharacterized protein